MTDRSSEPGFRGVAFLHTARGHVATFGSLMTELAPEIPVRHIVAEPLLASARHAGVVTSDVAQHCRDQLQDIAASGARVVVCTCTTLASCFDEDELVEGAAVQRIDRAAIEAAIEAACQAGQPITVAACLGTTLVPTLDLLNSTTRAEGRSLDINTLVIGEAWDLFESGDRAGYLRTIADAIRAKVPPGRVVVLSQASMAGAARLLEDSGLTIVSSPRPGVERAVSAWRTAAADPTSDVTA